MKPTYILANGENAKTVAVNTQDIKVAIFRIDGPVAIWTSAGDPVTFTCTTYTADKIKSTLRSRYNMATFDAHGVKLEGDHEHTLVVVKRQDAVVVIWPKALKSISLGANGDSTRVTFSVVRLSEPVVMDIPKRAAFGEDALKDLKRRLGAV